MFDDETKLIFYYFLVQVEIAMNITEEQLLNDFIEHYQTCPGKPMIMQFLGKKYGGRSHKIKFERFGFGGYREFMQRHNVRLQPYLDACRERMAVSQITLSVEDILEIIEVYGIQNTLPTIRRLYGNCPFSKYGYGTFQQFLERHYYE